MNQTVDNITGLLNFKVGPRHFQIFKGILFDEFFAEKNQFLPPLLPGLLLEVFLKICLEILAEFLHIKN